MTDESANPAPARILLVRPSALGDVCRTVPVLASLRRAFPDAEIDWLVQEGFEQAIEAHPALSSVVTFPRRRFARWWRRPSVAWEAITWAHDLRTRRYDVAIDAQGLLRSGLIAMVTGAPRRVGSAGAREGGAIGCNVRHRVDATHTVDAMLGLIAAEGIEPIVDMRLYTTLDAEEWWFALRERESIDRRCAVIAPGSRWPGKCWPVERWRALVPELLLRGFGSVVAVGSADERAQAAAALATDAPRSGGAVVNLVGRTSIGQMMAVIADAGLVVANDSAPLHMAVGFDRPLVGIFGATDPRRVGPYGRDDAVVRAAGAVEARVHFKDTPRAAALMESISLDAVLDQVDAQLAAAADAGLGCR